MDSKAIALHLQISGGQPEINICYLVFCEGQIVNETITEETTFSYMPTLAGNYVLQVIVTDGIGQYAECSTEIYVYPSPDPVNLDLVTSTYGYVGEKAITVQARITGGMEEFSFRYQVYAGSVSADNLLAEYDGPESGWSYAPLNGGNHIIVVSVTDGAGQTAMAQAEVPVAEKDLENSGNWLYLADKVALTGDWRKDIIAVAETQLGYRESSIDFIIDEEGEKQGYSIYGDWYGMDYVDWCAMFISCCLHYADVPQTYYPISSSCNRWKNALINVDAYEAVENDETENDYDGYMPNPGDLVFFWQEGYPKDEPHHIGIVTDVDENTIQTIEGNTAQGVVRREYALTDESIIGYANTAKLMARAGVFPEEELTVEIAIGSAQPLMLLSEDADNDGITVDFTASENGLAFQYGEVMQPMWNPNTHTYDQVSKGEWTVAETGGDTIQVANTSAVAVTVTAYVEIAEEYQDSVTVTANGQTTSASQVLAIGASGNFIIEIDGTVEGLSADTAMTIGRIYFELSMAE